MIYKWFQLFNKTEFEAEGLVSRELTVELQGIGIKTVLITKGNFLSITYEGIMLAVELNDRNPFAFDGVAVYVDADENVWLGIEVDED